MVAHTCDLNSLEMGTVELSLEGQLWVPKTPSAKTNQTKMRFKCESLETGVPWRVFCPPTSTPPTSTPAPWLSWLGAIAHQGCQQ